MTDAFVRDPGAPWRRWYLSVLKRRLKGLPKIDRERILAEIGSHLDDRAATVGYKAAAMAMGEPIDMAEGFQADYDAAREEERASWSKPRRVASLVGRAALVGASALVTPVSGVITLVLIGVVTLKLLNPAGTGLFVSGKNVTLQALTDGPPANGHEILGWWLIVLAILIEVFCVCLSAIILELGARHRSAIFREVRDIMRARHGA